MFLIYLWLVKNGVVKMVVRDKKNDTSTKTSMIVGETDKEFSFNFKVENIKIFPGSYEVVISQKLLARFVNKANNLTTLLHLNLIQHSENDFDKVSLVTGGFDPIHSGHLRYLKEQKIFLTI